MSWGPKFQPLDLRDPKILRKHLDINLIHLCLARVSIYSERHVESLRKRDGVRQLHCSMASLAASTRNLRHPLHLPYYYDPLRLDYHPLEYTRVWNGKNRRMEEGEMGSPGCCHAGNRKSCFASK